jgi:hypothetical protein
LNHDQNKLKFEALNILASVLLDVPAEVKWNRMFDIRKLNDIQKKVMKKVKTDSEKVYAKWLSNLLSGLRQILSSKVSKFF